MKYTFWLPVLVVAFGSLTGAAQEAVVFPSNCSKALSPTGLVEAADPFAIAASLGADPAAVVREVQQFEDILALSANPQEQARRLLDWVKSEAHALYVYQKLESFGPSADLLYDTLTKECAFFLNATPVRGAPRTLITYAFEKETRQTIASLMYKDPALSDSEWEQLSETQRNNILRTRDGLHQAVAPTVLKPYYLGKMDVEWGVTSTMWELKHPSYEFDRVRLLTQMRDLSGSLKETHSFHAHVVFDVPKGKNYATEFLDWTKSFISGKIAKPTAPGPKKFFRWYKQLNDYVYISGLEEGLHWNELTKLPELTEGPRGFGNLAGKELKHYTVGLRTHLYGDSHDPTLMKIGLELRDVTRNLDKYKIFLDQISNSVEHTSWETALPEKSVNEALALSATSQNVSAKISDLIAEGIEPAFAKRFLALEPTLTIGLEKYESAQFINFQTAQLETANVSIIPRIVQARKDFIQSLRDLQTEIKALANKGETAPKDDMITVLRMNLSSWAKSARVSELFSKI